MPSGALESAARFLRLMALALSVQVSGEKSPPHLRRLPKRVRAESPQKAQLVEPRPAAAALAGPGGDGACAPASGSHPRLETASPQPTRRLRRPLSPAASPEQRPRALGPLPWGGPAGAPDPAASPERRAAGSSYRADVAPSPYTPPAQVVRRAPTPATPCRGRAQQRLERWEWEAMQHGGSSEWGEELEDMDTDL
ncbi:unnamed protein product [Prorocentrum cordatum]|uniref:Uncharacterized protein n=1 Tax=Prorocentrum cordatum TaxID=2364126 RepID=A0ABN9W1M1_9DINO|nr:unnamed protein product [Polarella glacialis]